MPTSLISLLLPIESVCVRVFTAHRCISICHLISVFRVLNQWVYICYFDLQAWLFVGQHVSNCSGADARHIIVNPLICLVYTNALIWRGGPIHYSLGSQSNLCPTHQKGEVHQFGLDIAMSCNVCSVCLCVTVSSLFPGAYLSRAALVRVLCQLHVGPHRPGCALLR